MLDIPAAKGINVLPPKYTITPGDIDAAMAKQNVRLTPGDVVLLRTGTLQFWKEDGGDHELIKDHDSAGINLATAKYLIAKHGAIMIGSDTSGLEAPTDHDDGFLAVHKYLLIDQGVHIAEFHYLEDMAHDKVYEFCYIAMTNKIAGTTAGFAMRPIAIK